MSRSRRLTSPSCSAAAAAVSSRCRSTVKRCTGLCWARQRTASHSGMSATSSPAWSSDSSTATAGRPVPSTASRSSSAGSGHGVGQRRGLRGQPLEGERRDGQVVLGRGPGHPQHQPGIGPRVGVAGQHDLAVLRDDVAGQPDPLRVDRRARRTAGAARGRWLPAPRPGARPGRGRARWPGRPRSRGAAARRGRPRRRRVVRRSRAPRRPRRAPAGAARRRPARSPGAARRARRAAPGRPRAPTPGSRRAARRRARAAPARRAARRGTP